MGTKLDTIEAETGAPIRFLVQQAMSPVLEVKHLHKHYPAKGKPVVALHDTSLDLHTGQVFALLGANGAGKTTLSSILATLMKPTLGDVLFHGKSIYQDLRAYQRNVGYCPQRANLNNLLSLQDNLLFAGRFYGLSAQASRNSLAELTEQLNLEDYLDARPMVLSGGWKQRFMMARALMHGPKILILDEPTVGLDPQIRQQIWEKIRLLKAQGVSILLTTHYLDEAEQLADWVCMMDKGSIKLIAKPDELMDKFQLSTLEAVYLQLMQEEAGA
ncbi:MAG: ABC transporter ATP-binding protein [Myxococcota bacterium]